MNPSTKHVLLTTLLSLSLAACERDAEPPASPESSHIREVTAAEDALFAPDPCTPFAAQSACNGHPSRACTWVAVGAFNGCVSIFERTLDETKTFTELVLPDRQVTLDQLVTNPLTASEKQVGELHREDMLRAFRGEDLPDSEANHHISSYCGHGQRYEQIITLVSYFSFKNYYCGSICCHDHLQMHYHPFSDHGRWRTCGGC